MVYINKTDLLKLAYPLGRFVLEYTNQLEDKDYDLCRMYQDYSLSFAESNSEKKELNSYWS